MFVVLPAFCLVLIFSHILRRRPPGTEIRSVFLSAAVVWGVALAGITELLSLLNAVTAGAMAACWAIVAAGLAAALLAGRPGTVARWKPGVPAMLALAMGLPIAVIVVGTGVSAAAGWPNQWDSMVYHLSRVDHWIQNGSVGFYPSHIVRQLYNPPGRNTRSSI